MSNITYYVAMGFERDEAGDIVALEPMESQSSSAAVARARSLAATKAGAIAFSRTGEPNMCSRRSLRSLSLIIKAPVCAASKTRPAVERVRGGT